MASLAETNRYLKDPQRRARIIRRNARESAIFEGANPRALHDDYASSANARLAASSKKRAKSS